MMFRDPRLANRQALGRRMREVYPLYPDIPCDMAALLDRLP